MSSLESVLASVQREVAPSDTERSELRQTVTQLEQRVWEAAADVGVSEWVESVTQTGSTARGTFVSGDRDIDLFIEFDPQLGDAEGDECLEKYGLEVAETVLPDGERDFAAHPYLKGHVNGFDVDLVPCYAIEDPSDITSAVDRTPHHTQYIESQVTDELASDVRVAKKFLKGIGSYGSDVATQGFSGFLTELLVLTHGGFEELLEWGSNCTPPVRIIPEERPVVEDGDEPPAISEDSSVVVVDPTDPSRNVAANLSRESFARFQFASRQFLTDPSAEYFEPSGHLSEGRIRSRAADRGTEYITIAIDRPDVTGDTLVPQLRRTRKSIAQKLSERGFNVVRSFEDANDSVAVLFFELSVAELPEVEIVEGPSVDHKQGAADFYSAYEEDDSVYGPYLRDDVLVVERPRQFVSAREYVSSAVLLDEIALRADVENQFRDQYRVKTGKDAIDWILGEGFTQKLSHYFAPSVTSTLD